METPEEVATAVAGLAELIAEPEPEPTPAPEPEPVAVEEIPEQVGDDASEPEPVVAPEPAPVPEPTPAPVPEPETIPEPQPAPEPMVAPEPEPAPVPEPVKETPEQVRKDEQVPEPDTPKRNWGKILLIALGAVAAVLVLCALLGRIAPGLMDHLLYSKEELEILRY